ncbi:MAG: DUF6569 family protein, partial [Acidobacteriota bacterium]|nr:DUF6569 family protein [Acidobacteriota bacterium]
ISGPYQHENLAIFLLHGKDATDNETSFLSLNEALQKNKIVVKETGDVNRLVIKNTSDQYVFIQAGDIVRGGKQDRLMAYDLLLEPRSGKVSIDAFCVERGRWGSRGAESAAEFASSENRAPAKLKAAYREEKSQGEVWKKVEEMQTDLGVAVDSDLRRAASPTSLEMSLDSEKVKKAVAPYNLEFEGAVDKHDDAIGAVALINGEIHSANVYAWHELFVAVWPQLVAELAVDAVGAEPIDSRRATLSADELRAFLLPTGDAETVTTRIAPGVSEEVARYGDAIQFVNRDADHGWIRAETVRKEN